MIRAIVLALALTGCASKPVATIPVAMLCLGKDPQPPVYLYGVGDYPGEVDAVRILEADFSDAKGYIVELKAQMAGCR